MMTAMRIPGGVATRIALVVTGGFGSTRTVPARPDALGYTTLAALAPAMSSAAR
jgi:hypothetical protein